MIRLMDSRDDFVGPVNIGNPNEFSIRELADEVRRQIGDVEIIQHPLPADDPRQRQPDISLARAELGWEPKVQLREGLAKTVDYFRGLSLSRP
jgi:UDP-glucuronate decarboxylase